MVNIILTTANLIKYPRTVVRKRYGCTTMAKHTEHSQEENYYNHKTNSASYVLYTMRCENPVM